VRSGHDRVLLGGQPERVPTHRVKDVDAAHAEVPRNDVGRRVPLGMPHVQALARRIREHIEHVALGSPRVALGAERLVLVPIRLPFRLDGSRVVTIGHDATI
jgi:hypothetical protein